jgi:hypothetical protein
MMNKEYGVGKWEKVVGKGTGAGSEFSKIKKYGDAGFE